MKPEGRKPEGRKPEGTGEAGEGAARWWITLGWGVSAAGAETVATTSDPALLRQVFGGLIRNILLEDDHGDRVAAPDFPVLARDAMAALSGRIRRDACRDWPDETQG